MSRLKIWKNTRMATGKKLPKMFMFSEEFRAIERILKCLCSEYTRRRKIYKFPSILLKMECEDLKTIRKDIELLKKTVFEIKAIVEIDVVNEDDLFSINEYKKEKTEKKLIFHEDIKKELDIDV